MGILNITPDSFSDGGCFLGVDEACLRAEQLLIQGADLIDIGGESTRPGAAPVSSSEELARVIPVIEHIRTISDVCLSIDTSKASVMRAAVAAGASMINDVRALSNKDALSVAAELNVPVCLMHMQGVPLSMQDNPMYVDDVVDEINVFFERRIEACLQAGIPHDYLILDPGFGFGKSIHDNLRIVKRISEFLKHGLPLLLGVSRKSTIGAVLNKTPSERLVGGIALTVLAAYRGVSMIRTHDVDETRQALRMVEAVMNSEGTP